MPAAADDYEYDDLAGYNSGSASPRGQSSALPSYSGAGDEAGTQTQHGEEEATESPDYTREAEAQ